MKRCLQVLGSLVFAMSLAAAAAVNAEEVKWRPDVPSAMAEAKKSGSIVMIDVFTDWCGWCAKLDDETYSDAKVSALLSRIVTVKVNPEKGGPDAKFVSGYDINGYPNILFIDASGKLVDRIDGFMPAAAFAKKLGDVYSRNGVSVPSGTQDSSSKSIAWLDDLDKAFSAAASQNKVVMVDVFADWCGWCTKLDEDTYGDPGVIDLSSGFVPLKLDSDKNPKASAFMKKYGVTGFPTILFLEPDGSLVNRIGGYVDAKAFAAKMQATNEYRGKIKAYLAEFRSGRYANSASLLSMLVELDRVDEAIPVFDKLAAGSSLSASDKEEYALAIASSLIDSEDYSKALSYLTIAESRSSPNPNTYTAYSYHSIVIYYMDGKDKAMAYLDSYIASNSVPSDWKDKYKDLRERMAKAK